MKRMTFVFLLLASCDMVEQEQAPPPPDHGAAVSMCDHAVTSICQKVAACSTIPHADCVAQFRASLNCARAVGVSSSYYRCLSEVGASSCQGLADASGGLRLPASCTGIVLVQ